MTVFQSLQAAKREGFRWIAFSPDVGLHIVELDRMGRHGRREKLLAFARPTPEDLFTIQSL